MSLSDENLARLFSQARNQEPVASLDETKKAFITGTVVAAGGVLATKGLLQLLTVKKWIIMLSTLSIITAGTLIITLNTKEETITDHQSPIVTPKSIAVVEEPQEPYTDTIQAPIYVEPEIPTEISNVNPNNLFELIEDEPEFLDANDFTLVEDADGIEFKTLPSSTKTSETPPSIGEIKSYAQRFDITENTTEADFEKMKEEAEKDGIDFYYKVKYNQDKLTKLRLEIRIESAEEGQSQYVMSSFSIQGEFNYTVAWEKNEDGQATYMYCGDSEDFDAEEENDQGSSKNATDDFESLRVDLEIDGLIASIDSLTNQMVYLTELNMLNIADEITLFEDELEIAMEEFERIEIENVSLDIKTTSAELLDELQEELKNIHIEIEQEEEKIEKELEEIEKEILKNEKKRKKDKKEH